MNDMMKEFIAEMRKNRRQQGLTLQQLSDITGISTSYLSKLENGLRSTPSWEIIQKIENALQISQEITLEVATKDIKISESKFIKKRISNKNSSIDDFIAFTRGQNLSVEKRLNMINNLIKEHANRGQATLKQMMWILKIIESIIYDNDINE